MIKFHYETSFLLKRKKEIKLWINNVIKSESREIGDINYIFCLVEYRLEHNIKYLEHDTLTDIITFNYCEENIISSDIMISIDRVKENSRIFENSFFNELNRVMIHGILHLIGYNDKTDEEKQKMREKEDYYLNRLSK